MTEMKTKTLDEQLHDMDEANKIYEFAETVLGCNDKQADIMSRTMRHKFKWSGVRLLWNGGVGNVPVVAVDHVDQICEYFARENYDFLLPTPKAAVEGFAEASIPGELLTAALNGSVTAKGKIRLLLGGNNADAVARTELLLKTERAKLNGANAVVSPHGKTRAEMNSGGDHSKNPWAAAGNTDQRGRYTDAAIARQMALVRAVGPEKAAQIAASVGNKLGDLYAKTRAA